MSGSSTRVCRGILISLVRPSRGLFAILNKRARAKTHDLRISRQPGLKRCVECCVGPDRLPTPQGWAPHAPGENAPRSGAVSPKHSPIAGDSDTVELYDDARPSVSY